MRKLKKYFATAMASIMMISAVSAVSGATIIDDSISDSSDVLVDLDFIDEIYETGEVFDYGNTIVAKSNNTSTVSASPSASVSGTWSISVNYFNVSRTLAYADADIYYFTASTARTYAVSFSAQHSNMVAILGIDNLDGSVSLTNVELNSGWSTGFNLPAGNWCWIVISYDYVGGWYELMGNGYNPSGLTNLTATPDLSIVEGWLNGVRYVNGVITPITNPSNPYNQGSETVTLNPGAAGVTQSSMIFAEQVRHKGSVSSSSVSNVDFLIRRAATGFQYITDNATMMGIRPGVSFGWQQSIAQSSPVFWQYLIAPSGNSTNGKASGTIEW